MPADDSSGLAIRHARPDDVPTLGRLGALLVRQHHEFDERRFLAPGESTAEHYGAFLGSQLDDADVVVLVAESGGRVVGYAYAAVEGYDYKALRGPAALLHDIIVEPGMRGRGLGQRLLEALLTILAERGVPRAVLSTAERNLAAQRLFERMGFRRTMVEMTRELGDLTTSG